MKKIIILSDTHSGHKMALTPPEYQTRDRDIEKIVSPFWDWFVRNKKDHYDIMLHLGDAIEGDDHKDAGFLLEPDLNKQIDIASAVIKSCNADKHYFCMGTPYHTATGSMDIDPHIARRFGDHGISWRRRIEIEGVKIDMSHTVGKTSTPVGGDIQLRKTMIWNQLDAALNGAEAADVIMRGHVHEYRTVGNVRQTAFSCPALKIGNADYDRYPRRMSGGYYDVGFIEMTVDSGKVIEFAVKTYGVKISNPYEVVE